MGPNFCSHLLTGSCFSKLQSAGGRRAKGLRHLLKLGQLCGPRDCACPTPHSSLPVGFAWRLNSTFSLWRGSSFSSFLFFLRGKTTYWKRETFLYPLSFFRVFRAFAARPALPCVGHVLQPLSWVNFLQSRILLPMHRLEWDLRLSRPA